MLVIISPAKTIDLNKKSNMDIDSSPVFSKEANLLAQILRNYNPNELESLMKIFLNLPNRYQI